MNVAGLLAKGALPAYPSVWTCSKTMHTDGKLEAKTPEEIRGGGMLESPRWRPACVLHTPKTGCPKLHPGHNLASREGKLGCTLEGWSLIRTCEGRRWNPVGRKAGRKMGEVENGRLLVSSFMSEEMGVLRVWTISSGSCLTAMCGPSPLSSSAC